MTAPRVSLFNGVPIEVERTRVCRCGRDVELGFSRKDQVPVVIHVEPVCLAFRDLSADDFIMWAWPPGGAP